MNKAVRKVAAYRQSLVCPKTGTFDTEPEGMVDRSGFEPETS